MVGYCSLSDSEGCSRRAFMVGGAAAGAALCSPRIAKADGKAFRFGLTPVFLSNDLELLDRMRRYFVSALGCDVQLVNRRTYQEITSLLVSGQLTSAWICGYPYVQYRSELDLVATPVWQGKPLYRSYIIQGADRRSTDWRSLRGSVHAFSDPDSNSGYLVTQTLLARNGMRPEDFFSHSFFTYGHRNVIRAVASGLAQSGSVDGYVWEVVRDLEPDLVSGTKVLRRSELLGFPPVASARRLRSDGRIGAFREVLTGMASDREGRAILEMLRLDGFAATQPPLYDTIADEMNFVRRQA